MREMMAATLEDHRLSRGERHALGEILAEAELGAQARAELRHQAFALARAELGSARGAQALDWLEGVVKLLSRPSKPPGGDSDLGSELARVCFSPGSECLRAILSQIEGARTKVDVCVFTITDDRLADALLGAHARGISLRIITDQFKAEDRGSDIGRLEARGVPLRVDRSEHHMHHKFATFDDRVLLTGSYNWTRSAAKHNQENILLTDDDRFVRPYQAMFSEFWDRLR